MKRLHANMTLWQYILAHQIVASPVFIQVRLISYTLYQPVGKIKIKQPQVDKQVTSLLRLKLCQRDMSHVSVFQNFWEPLSP